MNESFDFVIGSGGGSLCAAAGAAPPANACYAGKRTCSAALPRSPAAWMWILNNRYMKAEGIKDSAEQANAYLDAGIVIATTHPVRAASDAAPTYKRRRR